MDPARLIRFVERRPDVVLKPPATLTMDLREPDEVRRASRNRSWWTARARSEDVRTGFSWVEIQRAERDREGSAELFARVGRLLVELRGLETIES